MDQRLSQNSPKMLLGLTRRDKDAKSNRDNIILQDMTFCCILTFDSAKHAIPKTAEVTHSDGNCGKKSRRRAWLTIWDKVKSRGTVID